MKTLSTLFLFCFMAFGFAQQKDSPYLMVSTKNALIPLKVSKANVEIAGTIAHVQLTQVYHNRGKTPIEAKYIFPMSTQAAVHNMTMSIGTRTVKAKIFEKQEATKVYNNAVKDGKRAAKLDQERPNVFQMNLGNIMPDDEITIDIYYTEMLVPLNGEYQFVAPGVVGPRFTGEASTNETAFNMPYTSKGIADSFIFDLTLSIQAGMPIQSVSSNTHSININYPDLRTAEVFLSKSNKNPANRDFILNYNLQGKAIQSGLMLYEHGDESFFALQMEPGKSVKLEDIPAREYLFIVDVSGSMNGYPLEVSKSLMRNLLCDLRPNDTFNVQLFASSSTVFSVSAVDAVEENIEAAIRFLSEGQGGGGTQLLSALKQAYKLPRKDLKSARSMVVITDGYVNVEKEAFELIRANLDQANVFTFGIGSNVNRHLLEGMAKVSNSESFIATNHADAKRMAETFKDYIATPLWTQVKLEALGFQMYAMVPQSIPDVFSARPVLVYGKYKGKANGSLVLTGVQGGKTFKKTFKVSQGLLSKKNKALRYLWARKKIEILDDYKQLFDQDVKDQVVNLGLTYNLLTKYTSFVAVDESVVNKKGALKTIKQPLPMPAQVNNSAVGAEAKITSEVNYKRAFLISIDQHISKSDKRKIYMTFRTLYTKLVEQYLENYKTFRLVFNDQGKLIAFESLHHGVWLKNEKATQDFAQAISNNLKLNSAMSLTINQ